VSGSIDGRPAGLREAVEEFNRYHVPEVSARILRLEGTRLIVGFDGRSCRSCGGQDYLEDFAYEVGDALGNSMTLVHFERNGVSGFTGVYEAQGEL
jgi:hypothetical protein